MHIKCNRNPMIIDKFALQQYILAHFTLMLHGQYE